ncbi:MFS transporter [Pseudarthrobacter sp. NPDC058329]|uniref:MFS transporter n=1 Tax=Pseudarthrobacter sp. NPDC058329 TaxID=3346448 RepID=UPI0036DC0138
MTTAHVPPKELDQSKVRKAALAGLIGTTLELYDFVIYGTAAALVFGELFFPNESPAVAMIASFSTFAVGFLARPIGGIFFSHFGDRLGRKWVLVTTLLIMGGATLLIGLLPTYDQIGVWAPILLVLCRAGQGFGAGAEQSGGATLLTESARLGTRGKMASLIMVGAAAGTALGALVWMAAQALAPDDMMNWGWRLVFLSSIFVTIAAMVIRRKLDESPVFEEIKRTREEPPAPLKEVAKFGKANVLRVTMMTFGVSAQSYTIQVFMATYLISIVGVDPKFIPQVLLIGALCGGVAAVAFGILSDKIGRRRVVSIITGALVLFPAPAFMLLRAGSPLAIILVMVVGFMLACQGVVGVHMSYFPEIFGSRYRYAGVTLGREFASIIGGGIAPMICAGLLAMFSNSWIPVAIYMSLVMLVSFIATRMTPETLDRDLTDPEDVKPANHAVSRANAATTDASVAQHVK